ncbi:MAG TPA: nitric oxide dioxygenase, partial [Novosphingobium sp.]|nr:nitric oxide dioxygenase [Novosphingobium sp.]
AFVLRPGSGPVALISGGVGITPTLAMAESALAQGRDLVFIHYARNPQVQAFGATLAQWARQHPGFTAHVVLEEGAATGAPAGRPSLAQLSAWVPVEGDAYVLGPKPFMAFVNRALAELGVAEGRRHFEFFGPAEALA